MTMFLNKARSQDFKSAIPISNEQTNVYLSARREWNERYGSYISQTRNWQIIAITSLCLAGLACGGLACVGAQSKITPYVVEVDKLGEAVAVGVANKASIPDSRIIRAQLARWVTNARSVYFDIDAQNKAVNEAYALVGNSTPAFSTLADFHTNFQPFERAKTESVSISVQSVLPITKDSYRIEWREEVRQRDGQLISNTNWQAQVGISIVPPTEESKALINPMGIVINSISWSQRI